MPKTPAFSLRDKLAKACRILYYEGATSVGKGHQSFRLSKDRILLPGHMHKRGLALGDVRPDDIVTIDLEGNVVQGRLREPMGEFRIHTSIYKRRDDIQSIIHIHPTYTNALVCAGQTILPVTRDSLLFRDQVAVLERFPLSIHSDEIADEVARTLGNRRVLVHRGHGAIIVGSGIENALVLALSMERAARMQWMASVAGGPKLLPEEQMKAYTGHQSRSEEADSDMFIRYVKRLRVREKLGAYPMPY